MSDFLQASQNPIHELEVLPVLIASKVWGKRYEGALIVYYIENESARMAYVRGSGETNFASCVISDFVLIESQLQHKSWFGRCPSASNPAVADLTWLGLRERM